MLTAWAHLGYFFSGVRLDMLLSCCIVEIDNFPISFNSLGGSKPVANSGGWVGVSQSFRCSWWSRNERCQDINEVRPSFGRKEGALCFFQFLVFVIPIDQLMLLWVSTYLCVHTSLAISSDFSCRVSPPYWVGICIFPVGFTRFPTWIWARVRLDGGRRFINWVW